jgi:hypothetical protein
VLTPQARRLSRQDWTLYPRGAGAPGPLVLRSRGTDPEPGQCFDTQAFDSNAPPLPGRVACSGCTQLLPQVSGIGVLGLARFERAEDVTVQPDEASRRIAARMCAMCTPSSVAFFVNLRRSHPSSNSQAGKTFSQSFD